MKNFCFPGWTRQAGQDIRNYKDFYGHKFLLASEPYSQNSPASLSAEPAFCLPAVISHAAVARGPLCTAGEVRPTKNPHHQPERRSSDWTPMRRQGQRTQVSKASAQLPLCYSTRLHHWLAGFYRQIAPHRKTLVQTAPISSSWCPASFPDCGTWQNNPPCYHRIKRRAQKATAPVNKGINYLQVRWSCFWASVLPWLTISTLLAPEILMPGHCLTVWTRPLRSHTKQSHTLLDTCHIWHSLFPFPKKSKLFTWPLGLLYLLQSSERTKKGSRTSWWDHRIISVLS